MPLERVVISLGGSILVPGEGDAEYLQTLASLLARLAGERMLFLVTGGGRPARSYIEVGRALGLDERALDEMGIVVTRLNARLLLQALGPKASPSVAESYEEAEEAGTRHPLVVMGGVRVSLTTDGVAAELAERLQASRIVNATSVDGVYTADPHRDSHATRIDRMSYEELAVIAGEPTGLAGPSMVFDPHAVRVVKRAAIPLIVVHGRDLASLEGAIVGGDFVGTSIGA
ncbi:MAG: UMP kinase [Candidatus Thermoplasmatota archaeon]|nr:UMP kinase [Candidatus Thermoplasmatota archaeon]